MNRAVLCIRDAVFQQTRLAAVTQGMD